MANMSTLMQAALGWWEDMDSSTESTNYGDDIRKVNFSDGSAGLLLWRPTLKCWRLLDPAGYDLDKVPTRIIKTARETL